MIETIFNSLSNRKRRGKLFNCLYSGSTINVRKVQIYLKCSDKIKRKDGMIKWSRHELYCYSKETLMFEKKITMEKSPEETTMAKDICSRLTKSIWTWIWI